MTQKISDYVGIDVVPITNTRPGTAQPGQHVIGSSVNTIIPSDFILSPEPVSPLTGASGVSQTTTLSAGPFRTAYTRTRVGRRFQVQLVGGNWSAPVYDASTNADGSATTSLAANTAYEWRCRDQSIDGKFSDWSTVQSFSTGAASIQTPTISVEGELSSVPEGPVLVGSPFSITGSSETHVSTDWEVRKTSDNSLVYSSLADTVNKTTITVPKGFLLVSTQYTFKVRYKTTTFTSNYGSKNATTLPQFEYGQYLGVTFTIAPNIYVFGRNGDTYTKLDSPTEPSVGGNTITNVTFSSTGAYLAVVAGNNSNAPLFLTIYKRTGDTFTKLTTPGLNGGDANGTGSAAFSPNDNYFVGTRYANTASGVTVLKRTGDSFSQISLSGQFAFPQNVVYSPDGTHLPILYGNGKGLVVYKQTGDSFSSIYTNGISPSSMTYSPEGSHLIIGITVFKRNADSYSILPNAITLPPLPSGALFANGYVNGFSGDGAYLSIAHVASYNTQPSQRSNIVVYKRIGDTYTLISGLSLEGGSSIFTQDGLHLIVYGYDYSSTYKQFKIYKRSGDTFTLIYTSANLPNTVSDISVYPKAVLGSN